MMQTLAGVFILVDSLRRPPDVGEWEDAADLVVGSVVDLDVMANIGFEVEVRGMAMGLPRYIDDASLGDVVLALSELKIEGPYWDFKRQWHENKADLLHDIICLANNANGETGLLIFGIDEELNCGVCGVGPDAQGRKNTQQINDFLASKHWAESMPSVRVVAISLRDVFIDIVIVEPDNLAIPYYLTQEYKEGKRSVRAGAIYTRRQDGNVPLDKTASSLETERLWRRRFGLDKTPVEKLPQLLAEPVKWHSTKSLLPFGEYVGGYCYYHEDFPEFILVRTSDPDKDAWEYFMLASPFCHGPNWWTARLFYHQTLLCEIPGAYSDHLWIPAPRWAILRGSHAVFQQEDACLYSYFIEGSLERTLMQFELDESKEGRGAEEEVRCLDELVPVFASELERDGFEHWIAEDWGVIRSRLNAANWSYRVPAAPDDSEVRWEKVEKMAAESAVIVEMLKEYRATAQG